MSLIVRLAGTLAARLTVQNDLYRPAPVTRCFCSGAANENSANAAFARELQKRVASVKVQTGACKKYYAGLSVACVTGQQ